MNKKSLIVIFFALLLGFSLGAQDDHDSEQSSGGEATTEAASEHGSDDHGDHAYDPTATAIHHISDANVYSILDAVRIPLPMILYAPAKGWDFFMSNKFGVGHHEDGHYAYNGYVMHHGSVYRVKDASFPQAGKVEVGGFAHSTYTADGKEKDRYEVAYEGKNWEVEPRSALDGGLFGGGITSFYDFSVTKNVLAMIIVCLFVFWLFRKAARAYEANPDKAPSGVQGVLEPVFLFIRDEVAIPFLGKDRYMKYLPLLMSIFFFVLGLNLFGQVPFLGSTNVTGNLTVTLILAVIVFIIVNINGNKHYWQHVFNMPGVPLFVKFILTPVEIMGLFIKPLTLMVRLAGNISAGHIAILSFIGLIFIFGNAGANLGGSVVGTVMAIPLTLFMMAIELIVAFVQAFVFAILTASYIGAAIEEHHHAEEHH